MLPCVTQLRDGDEISIQAQQNGTTLQRAPGALRASALRNPVRESNLKSVTSLLKRCSDRQSRFPASGLVCAQPPTAFLAPSPGPPPHLQVQPSLRNSRVPRRSPGFQIQTMAARPPHGMLGVGGAFGTTPRRAAGSRSGLPTRSRKTPSNLGADLRTPSGQWAEGLEGAVCRGLALLAGVGVPCCRDADLGYHPGPREDAAEAWRCCCQPS